MEGDGLPLATDRTALAVMGFTHERPCGDSRGHVRSLDEHGRRTRGRRPNSSHTLMPSFRLTSASVVRPAGPEGDGRRVSRGEAPLRSKHEHQPSWLTK
jgi:hypothetical protein